MSTDQESAFQALRDVLRAHDAAGGLSVTADTPTRFELDAAVGPATIAAWRGRRRSERIPVAWVEHGPSYVGYHLMGLSGNARLAADISSALRKRMQGKTCFNFRRPDATLFAELAAVTAASIDGMRQTGFIVG